MTIVDTGKEKIISLINGALDTGSCGTSSSEVSASDTDLFAELTSTIETLTGSESGKQLLITYNLDSNGGNGNTLREYGNELTDGTGDTLFNRVTFTGLPKTNALEVQIKSLVQVI